MCHPNQRIIAALVVIMLTVLPHTATALTAAPISAPVDNAAQSGTAGLSTRIVVDATGVTYPVNKLLFGNLVLAVWRGNGLMDQDNTWDENALEMVRELGPTILRFQLQPIFEDAIGPQALRPTARCGWEEWHTNEYGIDEHMAYLEQIGAGNNALVCIGYPDGLIDSNEPGSCITSTLRSNISQLVSRAMAWVAYTNAEPDNPVVIGIDSDGFDWGTAGDWAQRRIDNGHPAPYGVKFWEIGNEPYWTLLREEPITPERYASDYRQFWTGMKSIDPTIVVGAHATLKPWGDEQWNIPLLESLGDYADALVIHPYYPGTPYYPELQSAVMAASSQSVLDIRRLHAYIASITGRQNEIQILAGEMGIDYDFSEETMPIPWNMHLVGVYEADMLGALVSLQQECNIAIGVQHWLHGHAPTCDIHYDAATDQRYRRPDYYALQLWSKHFGDVLLDTTVVCDTFDITKDYADVRMMDDVPYLAAWGSRRGSKLYLLVVNRHLSESVRAEIEVQHMLPAPEGRYYSLSAPSPESTNEEGNHSVVMTRQYPLVGTSRLFAFEFPACSVTVLELDEQQGPAFIPFICTDTVTAYPEAVLTEGDH